MAGKRTSLLAKTALMYQAGPLKGAAPAQLDQEIRQMDQPMLNEILEGKVCMRCRLRKRPCIMLLVEIEDLLSERLL